MLDGNALRGLIADEKPDFVVPEIEAIATEMLIALEQEGQRVVPCAAAAKLTMNREGIPVHGQFCRSGARHYALAFLLKGNQHLSGNGLNFRPHEIRFFLGN